MNMNLCRDFISYLDQGGSLKSGNAPKNIEQWLEELNLPIDLLRFMQWSWPQTDCQMAHIRIRSSAPLLRQNFLNVGSAPNGDWFVIDFSTEACAPGFITHEEWSPWNDNSEDPRQFFQPIARTFDAFLYRIVEERYLPFDYYAAKEFNAFLLNERNG